MTKQTPSQAAAAATLQQLAERVAALELYLQQLVFVLDAHGALSTDALTRWVSLARNRMQATGSTPPAEAAALGRLAQRVQE